MVKSPKIENSLRAKVICKILELGFNLFPVSDEAKRHQSSLNFLSLSFYFIAISLMLFLLFPIILLFGSYTFIVALVIFFIYSNKIEKFVLFYFHIDEVIQTASFKKVDKFKIKYLFYFFLLIFSLTSFFVICMVLPNHLIGLWKLVFN